MFTLIGATIGALVGGISGAIYNISSQKGKISRAPLADSGMLRAQEVESQWQELNPVEREAVRIVSVSGKIIAKQIEERLQQQGIPTSGVVEKLLYNTTLLTRDAVGYISLNPGLKEAIEGTLASSPPQVLGPGAAPDRKKIVETLMVGTPSPHAKEKRSPGLSLSPLSDQVTFKAEVATTLGQLGGAVITSFVTNGNRDQRIGFPRHPKRLLFEPPGIIVTAAELPKEITLGQHKGQFLKITVLQFVSDGAILDTHLAITGDGGQAEGVAIKVTVVEAQ